MDRRTAKLIRNISVLMKKPYRRLKKEYYKLSQKDRCRVKREMKKNNR